MPDSTKRILVIIAGAFALVASVLGFYYTSDAFDDRLPVLVAARDIAAGETVSSADFGSDLVLVGSIPHISWTADGPFLFEGMVAVQPIAAGALVLHDMFIAAETAPVGVELEVIVPLDLSLATGEVFDGDLVLLVDSGAEPVAGDEGRPRQVVRQFELANFDGSQMRLFLAPEQWAEWEALLADVGGRLMVVDLGIGADAEETAQRLDAVWHAQWAASAEEVAQAAAAAEPVAGPGELGGDRVAGRRPGALRRRQWRPGAADRPRPGTRRSTHGPSPQGASDAAPRRLRQRADAHVRAARRMGAVAGAARAARRRAPGASRGRRHRRGRDDRAPRRRMGRGLAERHHRGGSLVTGRSMTARRPRGAARVCGAARPCEAARACGAAGAAPC